MPSPARPTTLAGALGRGGDLAASRLLAAHATVPLAEAARGTCLHAERASLAGRSVLVATDDQLAAALALLELDGTARRIVLAPPDLAAEHYASVIADAAIDTIVSDRDPRVFGGLGVPALVGCGSAVVPTGPWVPGETATEWVLLTSGTTGPPKMVSHSLAGLTAAITTRPPGHRPTVWGTFYDIRRYGGLQIFLRSILGPSSLVLTMAGEALADHLRRLGAAGVTHLSGTPTHWRRVLMSPAQDAISPAYVRLSGEIADQTILDSLRDAFPNAAVGHAYASTEAGVGFEVNDGREGFPASLIGRRLESPQMRVEDGTLRIRSTGAAARYVGAHGASLTDGDGFVDTGDVVELRDDRLYFVGRRGGIINVGGLKVHPEEVEAVINRHRGVKMSLVKAKRNPITGAVVVADVVLDEATPEAARPPEDVKAEILQLCRSELAVHKVPALVRFVESLAVTPAGKLARPHA